MTSPHKDQGIPAAYLEKPKSLDQELEFQNHRRSNRKKLFSIISIMLIMTLISVIINFIYLLHLKNINSPIIGYPFDKNENPPNITRKAECNYWSYDDNYEIEYNSVNIFQL